MKLISIFSYLLFLIILSGITITSAADTIPPVPNMFYGNVSYNGDWCQIGTVIEAYIDNELRSEEYNVVDGRYNIHVVGNESDEGKTINFKINGTNTGYKAVWKTRTIPESEELDLIVGDLPISLTPDSPSSNNGGSSSSRKTSHTVTPTETSTTINTSVSEEGAAGIPDQTSTLGNIEGTVEETTENESSGFGVILAIMILIIGIYSINRKK